ncbi:choice-of-anchor L domain-containing protein [Roseovarius sp. MBR-51]
MAQTIFGDGVQVIGASYTGDRDSSGIYSNGNAISPGVVPSDTGVMFSTGDLRSFTNNNFFQSNLSANTTTTSSGPNGVATFNAAAGAQTYVNGGVKFGHCGGAKVGQFGASALERAALI